MNSNNNCNKRKMIDSTVWDVQASDFGKNTSNPLRKIWENPNNIPNPLKKMITLQIGDPTVFKNFLAAPESKAAIRKALDSDDFSYTVSPGLESARQAVAEYVNDNNDKSVTNFAESYLVSHKDVILTSGCSMALEMCFRVLANSGENILLPRPCWNYSTWIEGCGINIRYFNLNPTKDWEVDLTHLESMINDKTRAILINNPGNPCGNVYSKEHILDILEIAERHKLPIIADEVYEFFTFPGIEFFPLSTLSTTVPILSCSGLTKRFIMPASRMGWIVIHDRNDRLKEVRQGLMNIAGRNFWPNSTLTKALPDILKNVPEKFFADNSKAIYKHALSAYKIFETCPGISPIMPRGAMYMMIGIELEKFPGITSCFEFSQKLLNEQSVGVFPGSPCFSFPGFFRIVLTVPEDLIIEACERIKEFCEKHCKYDKEKYLKSG